MSFSKRRHCCTWVGGDNHILSGAKFAQHNKLFSTHLHIETCTRGVAVAHSTNKKQFYQHIAAVRGRIMRRHWRCVALWSSHHHTPEVISRHVTSSTHLRYIYLAHCAPPSAAAAAYVRVIRIINKNGVRIQTISARVLQHVCVERYASVFHCVVFLVSKTHCWMHLTHCSKKTHIYVWTRNKRACCDNNQTHSKFIFSCGMAWLRKKNTNINKQ